MKTFNQFLTESVHLPELTGSEKQIAWAEKIRSGFLKKHNTDDTKINPRMIDEPNQIVGKVIEYLFSSVGRTNTEKMISAKYHVNFKDAGDVNDENNTEYDKIRSENKNILRGVIINLIDQFFTKISDSKFWIDYRDNLYLPLVRQLSGKEDYLK